MRVWSGGHPHLFRPVDTFELTIGQGGIFAIDTFLFPSERSLSASDRAMG